MRAIYADTNTGMAAMFGSPSQEFHDRVQQGLQNFSRNAINLSPGFLQRAQDRFHDSFYGEAARRVESIRSSFNAFWDRDTIRPLTTLGELQNAKPIMQRYAMAEPNQRRLYLQNRCEGYGDEYLDTSPGEVGTRHYDYRVATNGLVMTEKHDGKEHWISRQHIEAVKEETPLTINTKAAIEITHKSIRALLENDLRDSTSKHNALLG